jgi:hypothetical protein
VTLEAETSALDGIDIISSYSYEVHTQVKQESIGIEDAD